MRTVIIVSSAPAQLCLIDEPIGHSCALRGTKFRAVLDNEWVAFYDWLRRVDRQIIGVRSWMTDPELDVVKTALAKHEAFMVNGDEVRVYFGRARDHVDAISGDQSLGDHRVLVSDSGVYMLTFEVEGEAPEIPTCRLDA